MFRVTSIDPGDDTGWAFWEDGRVAAAGLGAPPSFSATPDLILIEVPMVYPGGPKVDPNDLVKLALTAGRQVERLRLLESIRNLGAKAPPAFAVYPRTWKGTLDKLVMVRRIQAMVGPSNNADVEAFLAAAKVPAGKRHNVWDAVGLGHWAITNAMNGAKLGKGPMETLKSLKDYEFLPL